jgi:triacylglycerol lipase
MLAHGFLSSAAEGFAVPIVDALTSDGFRVYRSEVPAIGTVANRAQALASQVDQVLQMTGARRVHFVAHSMGGLDVRYLVSLLGYADRVASVTTISTPHQGSALADVALGVSTTLGLQDQVLSFLATIVVGSQVNPGQNPQVRAALSDLAESSAAAFNVATPNSPGVLYQSFAGVGTVAAAGNPNISQACQTANGAEFIALEAHALPALFVPTAPVVAHGLELRPHDGVVTVASARWGVFRGCFPSDHFAETDASAPMIALYRRIARDLATVR